MTRPTFDQAREALRTHFGYADFRAGQDEIVRSVLEGHDTIAVMPTGGGKSICYQIPALLFEGLTIVVSPLISLMQDQVEALLRASIRATFINSMLEFRDINERIEKARHGWYKLMYVAPERFESSSFLEQMRTIRVALFAIDEAHCISEWGHDFRPSYLRMKEAVTFLDTPQVVALTATATPDVRSDIRVLLGLKEPKIIVRGFDRPNLSFRVMQGGNKRDAILSTASTGTCGIVYAGSRATVEELAGFLRMHNVASEAYHAGLGDFQRKEVQERFMRGETKVIVATTAFGMGIDKRDVRFVLHHDMPSSIEQYYQEAGRAGRDGGESVCTVLYHSSDRSLPEYFIRQMHPDKTLVQNIYTRLHHEAGTQLGQEFRGLVNTTASVLAQQVGRASETAVRSALELLERSGYIRRVQANYELSTVKVLYTPDRLREWLISAAPPELHPIAVTVLRTAGSGAFHEPVSVVLGEMSEKSFIDEDNIYRGLRELDRLGIISFHSGPKASGIALLGQRIQARDLQIDYHRLEERVRHQLAKIQAMERYLLGSLCRRNMILEYFDETDHEGVCGKCDNCTASKIFIPPEDRDDVFEKYHGGILHCVAELSGKFGRTTIVDVLRGARTKRIAQYRLYEAATYRQAQDVDKRLLLDVVDTLIGLGWLAKTDSLHPSVYLTDVGQRHIPFPVEPLKLPRPAESAEVEVQDHVLYQALRAVRRRVATENNIPSHTLLPDAVLRNIANLAPTTAEELLAIEGMGPGTMKKCGKQFLRTIADHRNQRSLAHAAKQSQEAMPGLPPTLRSTFALCVQGLGLEEIAEQRNLTIGTVSQQISELIDRGVRVDLNRLIPEKHQEQIRAAYKRIKRVDLKKLKALIDEDVSYAEIRIMIAVFEKEKRDSS